MQVFNSRAGLANRAKKDFFIKAVVTGIGGPDFKIIPSKYPDKGNGKCLFMQVTFEDKMRVVFTGSVILQDMIQRVDKSQFPFETTIVDKNKHYKFT